MYISIWLTVKCNYCGASCWKPVSSLIFALHIGPTFWVICSFLPQFWQIRLRKHLGSSVKCGLKQHDSENSGAGQCILMCRVYVAWSTSACLKLKMQVFPQRSVCGVFYAYLPLFAEQCNRQELWSWLRYCAWLFFSSAGARDRWIAAA